MQGVKTQLRVTLISKDEENWDNFYKFVSKLQKNSLSANEA